MKTQTKTIILWILFALFAIAIGLYPLGFLSTNFRNNGVLSSKPQGLRSNPAYLTSFYLHISFGGLAILTGWSQFIKSWRNKYLKFHRYLGYVYVISVLISSISGFIIAIFSTGGTIAAVGFGSLAVAWFISNIAGLTRIKQGDIKEHEKWMMRNYALTFSAVTLRIYLPILLANGASIELTLKIVSWLCWIPNITVMETYIQRRCKKVLLSSESKLNEKQDFGKVRESIGSELHDFKRNST